MRRKAFANSKTLMVKLRDILKTILVTGTTLVIGARTDRIVSSTPVTEAVIGQSYSVAIVVRFEGTFGWQTQVFGLLLCQFGQLDAEFVQVGRSHLFIQLFR